MGIGKSGARWALALLAPLVLMALLMSAWVGPRWLDPSPVPIDWFSGSTEAQVMATVMAFIILFAAQLLVIGGLAWIALISVIRRRRRP